MERINRSEMTALWKEAMMPNGGLEGNQGNRERLYSLRIPLLTLQVEAELKRGVLVLPAMSHLESAKLRDCLNGTSVVRKLEMDAGVLRTTSPRELVVGGCDAMVGSQCH